MSTSRKHQIGLWVAVATLAVTIMGTVIAGSLRAGRLSEEVYGNGRTADRADARSIGNKSDISGNSARQEVMLKSLERIEVKIDRIR